MDAITYLSYIIIMDAITYLSYIIIMDVITYLSYIIIMGDFKQPDRLRLFKGDLRQPYMNQYHWLTSREIGRAHV